MYRNLNPAYPYAHALIAIDRLDNYEDLKVFKAVIDDDTDNYTATEFLQLRAMLQRKQTDLLMRQATALLKSKK